MTTNPLTFQYQLRSQVLETLQGDERSLVFEQRDRELEDYLGQIESRIADTGWQTGTTPTGLASATISYGAVGSVVTVSFSGTKNASQFNDQFDWITLPARYWPKVTMRGSAVAFASSAATSAFQNGLRLNVTSAGIVSTIGMHPANAYIQGSITYLLAAS